MSKPTQEFVEAFSVIADLAIARNAHPLGKHDGCWETELPAGFWIAVNGHKTATKCSRGIKVAPFQCYAEFNGWPFATFSPFGGVLGAGAVANEDSFIEALRAALEGAA